MLFKDIIIRKRDGLALDQAQIEQFVAGLTDGSLPAEQVSALAMAILLRGMSPHEIGLLTRAMAQSGRVMEWDSERLGGPVVDKHSTGGVGDKVSFLLAPIAAACGCFVPMISGRGLGHTGGTLDKAQAIPGYDPVPGTEVIRRTVREVGCAILGQTNDVAPADRRLYAIRDVTGTVESVALITASILSKKLAAGNDALVMDVKVGTGAFMATMDDARALSHSLLNTANPIGLKTHAVFTDMSDVLGSSAGNAVEIAECVDYLTGGRREARLDEVTQALCAEMLLVSGLETDMAAARAKTEAAVTSGKAAEIFARMVAALGGPADFLDQADKYLVRAAVQKPVYPDQAGYLVHVDGRAIGNTIIDLGGGRRRLDDVLDLSVGFTEVAHCGDEVGPDAPLAVVHAADDAAWARAAAQLRAACRVESAPPSSRPIIIDRLRPDDLTD